jgi:hypothetical protein
MTPEESTSDLSVSEKTHEVPDPLFVSQEKQDRGLVIIPGNRGSRNAANADEVGQSVANSRSRSYDEYVPALTGPADSAAISNVSIGTPTDPPSLTQPKVRSVQNYEASIRRSTGPHRTVTSRKFQIGYKVDDVGPSGIAAVELFITEDHGRKWWKYGEDADQQSPFDVEVPHDGEFGFAVRVRSGAGLSREAPLQGDSPEIVVSVDQTPPVIELMPIHQGQGSNINRLLIRWRVSDEHLAERPISIWYAANRKGPWEKICDWREDRSGAFEWKVGLDIPPQFYIRVSARDTAGNITHAETPQPIIVDLVRPTAKIIDVETPAGNGPQ